ncbi:FG-GAP-like repeat-containing protein [Streptomyces leeuwenhoekii]|uniref:FG-GAP-like repeat-containing protein n=1 Tax=Streptomyces leeuwenhoekii TaxID=1437453 RepID=UPI0036FEE899
MHDISRRQRHGSDLLRRALVAALAGGTLGLTSLTGAAATPAAGGTTTVAGTEQQALQQAAQSGEPVEVVSARTETSETHALPNGNLRHTQHTLPVRVKREGEWLPVDTTLTEAAGRVAPRAASGNVTFSAGGDTRLVTLVDQGRTLSLTWPEPLPEPALEGSVATYREVFPGVDLAVQASVDGFSQALIVKTPEAAAQPELDRIDFGLRADGLELRQDTETGSLRAVNPAGQTVFASSTARMWDSSGTEPTVASVQRSTGLRTTETLSPEAPTSLTPGSKSSEVDVRITGDRISLTPDQELLESPDTEYPVYIDPRMTGTREAWTIAYKPHPTSSYWNGTGWSGGTTSEARVGYESSTGGTARSFFRIGSKFLAGGVKVVDAQFQITETHSWSCTPKPVELYLTGGISSSTTWSNQPTWSTRQDRRDYAHGNESFGCPDKAVDFDATDAAVKAAAGEWSNVTFGLRAPQTAEDGKDVYSWKKFKPDAKLIVEFNRPPKAPWALDTVPSTKVSATECGNGSSYVTVGNTDVTLTAQVWDPDGGNVNVQFLLWATGKNEPNAVTPGILFDRRVTVTVSKSNTRGAQARIIVPKSLLSQYRNASNGQFSWKAQAEDATDPALASDWTPTMGAPGCRFGFDPEAPATPPKVTSVNDLYPETITGEPVVGAVARTDGVFAFEANGVLDTVEYLWGLDRTPPSNSVKPATKGGRAERKITPLTPGPHTLYVRSVDEGGNPGPIYPYRFYADSPEGGADKPGDLNGDSMPDMLAVDDGDNLLMYGGIGNGAVATKVPLSTGNEWGSALLTHRGDWTQDAYEDLIARRSDGNLWLYPNNGLGEFTSTTRQQLTVFPDAETGVAIDTGSIKQIVSVGDLNEDTYPDVIAVIGDQLWFLPGYFGNKLDSGYLIGTGGWARMQLASPGDVDGDSFTDLVARDTITGELWLYHGRSRSDADGDGVPDTGTDPASLGTMVNRTAYATGWTTASRPLITASGDSDGDGIPDMWTTTSNPVAGLEFIPGRKTGQVGPSSVVGTGGWHVMRTLS